ncbi:hypothetical protein CJP74_02130, partial [Psittacicella melopsittaci]
YSKEYLFRNVTNSTLSFLGSKLYSSHVNSVLGFKNTFADKAIAKTLNKFKHIAAAGNVYLKLDELRLYTSINPAEQVEEINTFTTPIKSSVKKTSNQPQLRFAGFSKDWNRTKLGDLVRITTGKVNLNEADENGKYNFYTCGIKVLKTNSYAFEGPAITIAGNGSIGFMQLVDGKFNAYQRTYVLQDFKADRGFLFNVINKPLDKKIKMESRVGVIPYIVLDMLTDLHFYLPEEREQQRIGSFFKDVDNKINSLQNALSKSKELKRTLISKLLVVQNNSQPELRFSGFNKYWKKGELDSIFDDFKIGRIDNISRLSQEKTEEFRYPVYSSKTSNNGICGYFDTYSFENSITWTTDGEYAGDVKYREGKFQASIHCGIMISSRGYSCVSIAEMLNKIVYRHATRANIPRVSMGTLKQIVISYPEEIEELQKLNCLFTDINNLISTYEVTLENHKKLKQALVQRMFV